MSAPTAFSRPAVGSAPPGPPARRPGTAVAATIAVLLGALALDPVFAARSWLPPVAGAVLLVGLGGAALRAAADRLAAAPGRPAQLAVGIGVPAGQALLVLCLLTAGFAADRSFAGVLPTWSSLADLGAVLADGRAEILEQATPALPLTGLVALTTVFVALVALAVDLVAVAGRQPALGGLGLLVLYCVPVSTITGSVSPISFLAPATGFGVLLWADQRDRLVAGSRTGPGSPLGTGAVTAVRTGVLALVAGILLPVVVPMLGEGALAAGLGSGTGAGTSTGTSLDPVAELRGELNRPEPVDLLELSADVEEPGYLRAVTLDEYSGEGWRMSNLNGQRSIDADTPLAPLPPRSAGRTVTATITATGHDDQFLPTLSAPQVIDVQGDDDDAWRFDPGSDTVFGRETTTAEQSWEVVAEEPGPSPDQLAAAADPDPGGRFLRRYTELPPLDPSVLALVDELTDPGQSPYQRVRAISDHLTDRGNGFAYSLATQPGTSGDDLVDFLRLKRGYCEQYAGAMGVLVRAAGVPARVVLGYTPGERTVDGPRVITSDDAHAWVEAWFDGFGWVPFDPTPIGGGRAVPLEWAPRADAAVDPASTPVVPGAPVPAPTGPEAQLDRDDQFTPVALPAGRSGVGTAWATAAATVLAVLLVGALPWAARRRQRAARLADGRPGALWDELLATTTDLGIAVPRTGTPRTLARQLAELTSAVDPAAVPAVRELALAEERAVYGPPGAAAGGAPGAALAVVRRALLRTVSRPRRLAAALWPASTVGAAARWLAARVPRRPRSA